MTETAADTQANSYKATFPSLSNQWRLISVPMRATLLLSGVFLFLVHLLCLGRYPSLGGDEVYFSPTAYSLITHGVFARPIHPGPAGFTIRDYFPPVITLLMAGSYKIFGFGGWQTRLVTLLCGLAASVVLFSVVKKMTGNLKAALLASAVFVIDPEVFHSWQTGHYEAVFELVSLLVLFLGVISLERTGRRLVGTWGLAGFFTAILAMTYYPFALPGWLVALLMMHLFLWRRREVNIAQKRRATAAFGLGALPVFGLFAWHVSIYPALFNAQIVSQLGIYSGAAHGGSVGIVHSILSERYRYLVYLTRDGGLFELLLEAFAVFLLFLARKQGTTREQGFRSLVLGSVAIWLGFLFFYSMKQPSFLADAAPYLACAVALAWQENFQNLGRIIQKKRLFLWLTAFSLVVGTAMAGLVGYTVLRQWRGRDYSAFARVLTSVIPVGSKVVGPQTIWFALAPRNPLRLYTVGGEQIEVPTGTTQLNNPDALNSVTYVVLPAQGFEGPRLDGLVANVHSRFVLVRKIRMPFVSLPWTKHSPYDVDVYIKRRA